MPTTEQRREELADEIASLNRRLASYYDLATELEVEIAERRAELTELLNVGNKRRV